ncbi:hypothetical protein FN846DRAFT_20178 [Sphaerosporella brunnea]|uniref:Uncharacterized protein n=1 Tax=Sphaerosporella brunnea TaxID=1250544 RepID=A0A5J5EWF4_9PEZI|nr:hypothetical protein FN846DRAFT_20178 [Sphaerosporella brunnea]
MAPPAPAPAQAQFHRFRLSEFQRSGTPSGSPAGQCSRFRVSDFIPYGSNSGAGADGQQQQQQQQQQPQVNGAAPPAQGPAANSNASPRQTQPRQPQQPAPGTGSYSVLHMDIEASQPQHTSTLVASTGGRGILQKIPMKPPPAQNSLQSPLNGQQPRPIVPAPPPPVSAQHMPSPVVKFDPSQYPEDVRWELARVVGNIQTNPTEFTGLVVNALLTNPSLQDNSLLRHIGALFPQLPPAPPAPPPEADPEKPVKRKRGRPPTKNKPPQVSTGAGSIQPAPAPVNSMGPPVITVIPSRKDKDVMQTCTRCLKPFNPAWRPTPASDPSSEATCAVRHPYPDFQTGLVVSLPTRKRNNYKTTWRWRCCGREVQSQSDEVNVLPRKEDDKTGGWCFVGKHTTEPGVREKFGLKPGKGKMIDEVADITDSTVEGARKKAKLDSGTAVTVDTSAAVSAPASGVATK